MELLEDKCHWCEVRITRPSENVQWICDYESAECEFHPAAWDSVTLKSTGVTAPHQTELEVAKIVAVHFWNTRPLGKLRAIDSNVVSISKRAQRTSKQAANNILPRSGTMRRKIYELVNNRGGMTDYELETQLSGKHQSVSASRRSLVVDGWLVDSGTTRKNLQGNDCIVWVVSGFNEGTLFA